jgi:hypothetical protein
MRKVLLIAALALTLSAGNSDQKVDCGGTNPVPVGITPYLPAVDGTGKTVFLKMEYAYKCQIEQTEKGACVEWEKTEKSGDLNDTYDPKYERYVSFDHSASFGAVMMGMENLNRLDKLFTGWKGTCIRGTITDFSFIEDPMFWANMAMMAAQGLSEAQEAAKGQDWYDAVQRGEEWPGMGNGSEVFAKYQEARDLVDSIKTISCMADAGANVAEGLVEYFGADKKVPCDPKDEICSNEQMNDNGTASDITTLSCDEFKYMKDNFFTMYGEQASELWEASIVVIKACDNVSVTFKYSPPPLEFFDEVETEDAMKAAEKLRRLTAGVRMAIGAAKAASCITDAGDGSSSAGSSGDSRTKPPPNSSLGIGFAVAEMGAGYLPFPYNMAATAVLNLAQSFKSLNSCSSKADAAEQGSLHEKTKKAKDYNMCIETEKDCETKIMGECSAHRYYFCCYDSALTKELMIQIKAQLGKSWDHCADLSLKELQYLRFDQCDMSKVGTDGTHNGQDPSEDNKNSVQAKNHCMDLTGFREQLMEYAGGAIDDKAFFDSLEDIKFQMEE